jgi:four helix bundle protein
MDLADRVYNATERFPSHERFGLSAQARRAAISVAANIAEGSGQGSRVAFARYLSIARGSLNELDSHLELARRRRWVDAAELAATLDLLDEVRRLLGGLRRWAVRRAG